MRLPKIDIMVILALTSNQTWLDRYKKNTLNTQNWPNWAFLNSDRPHCTTPETLRPIPKLLKEFLDRQQGRMADKRVDTVNDDNSRHRLLYRKYEIVHQYIDSPLWFMIHNNMHKAIQEYHVHLFPIWTYFKLENLRQFHRSVLLR